MRIRALFVTLVGIGIAGGSVFMAKEIMLVPSRSDAAAENKLVDVLVARKPIEFGQAIESHLLKVQSWPAESVPRGSFSSLAALTAPDGKGVRRAKAPFFEGEVILASKLSDPGDKVTIVQKLGQNTRAMAIKVDAVTAVGGFVTPGDFVDILMTQGNKENLRTVTILQNIRVIGVDQKSEEESDAPGVARTVTVEVTPVDGQKLALAQKAGTLSLTLRTLEDVVDEPLQMIGLSDLLQEESPVAEEVKRPTVRVRRAGAVEDVLLR